jgi:multiple antibiotic resistance protein
VSSGVQNFINELVMMWVLIDPIGTIPVFLMVTASLKEEHRRMIATRAVVVSGIILIAFLFGGHLLLRALGIPLPSFQIAGGIVLFLFALTMIFGPTKADQEREESGDATLERAKSVAVFPLAIPSIASPGAMLGVVLLNDTEKLQVRDSLLDLAVIAIVLGVTLIFMYSAKQILRVIGDSGASVLSRIMGLILAAVAVDSVLTAVAQFFKISGIAPGGLL